ncbi:MAG: FecR domain-containing protein [Bdellovibrionales bacterium]|nr:FecR domain-containing protein [Bdellovibrionales bacterium]
MKKSSLAFLFTLFAALIFSPAFALAKVHGTFRVVKGDVKVKSPNGKIQKARIGQKVFPQDTIITAKDSRAKVVMIDDNVINISPESEIVFEKYEYEPKDQKKDVLIDVIYGKVRSKVNQKYDGAQNKFRVKTPSAVAGVRGTDFFTSFDKGTRQSQVVTFEGEVKYGLPGPDGSIKNAVSVRAGQMASNIPGRPPAAPQAVPKTQLANMDQGSDADKSDDKTDQRQPAQDENKKPEGEEKKDEAKKEEGNKDEAKKKPPADNKKQAQNGNPKGPGPGKPERGPASEPKGPSFLRPGDLPGDSGAEFTGTEGPNTPPPPPALPPLPPEPPKVVECPDNICKDRLPGLINDKSNLIIRINK